jgi:putative Mg2+ transporter-C (MgtC) family protein
VAELTAWEVATRLLAAAVLGALIGAEREVDGKDAGLRTHLMLSLGAAVFGVVSVGGFDDFAARQAETNFQVDVTRIASYVAAGVGFIGGGVILKHAGTVRGLTTAATLWVAAAIGLACGVGFWAPAGIGAVVGLLSLIALRPARSLLQRVGRGRPKRAIVVLEPRSAPAPVIDAILGLPLDALRVAVVRGEDEGFEIEVELGSGDPQVVAQCLAELARAPAVRSVRAEARD